MFDVESVPSKIKIVKNTNIITDLTGNDIKVDNLIKQIHVGNGFYAYLTSDGTLQFVNLPDNYQNLYTKVSYFDVGSSHYSFLDEVGRMYSWGSNNFGQLGNGGTTTGDAPTRVIDDAFIIPNIAGIDALQPTFYSVDPDAVETKIEGDSYTVIYPNYVTLRFENFDYSDGSYIIMTISGGNLVGDIVWDSSKNINPTDGKLIYPQFPQGENIEGLYQVEAQLYNENGIKIGSYWVQQFSIVDTMLENSSMIFVDANYDPTDYYADNHITTFVQSPTDKYSIMIETNEKNEKIFGSDKDSFYVEVEIINKNNIDAFKSVFEYEAAYHQTCLNNTIDYNYLWPYLPKAIGEYTVTVTLNYNNGVHISKSSSTLIIEGLSDPSVNVEVELENMATALSGHATKEGLDLIPDIYDNLAKYSNIVGVSKTIYQFNSFTDSKGNILHEMVAVAPTIDNGDISIYFYKSTDTKYENPLTEIIDSGFYRLQVVYNGYSTSKTTVYYTPAEYSEIFKFEVEYRVTLSDANYKGVTEVYFVNDVYGQSKKAIDENVAFSEIDYANNGEEYYPLIHSEFKSELLYNPLLLQAKYSTYITMTLNGTNETYEILYKHPSMDVGLYRNLYNDMPTTPGVYSVVVSIVYPDGYISYSQNPISLTINQIKVDLEKDFSSDELKLTYDGDSLTSDVETYYINQLMDSLVVNVNGNTVIVEENGVFVEKTITSDMFNIVFYNESGRIVTDINEGGEYTVEFSLKDEYTMGYSLTEKFTSTFTIDEVFTMRDLMPLWISLIVVGTVGTVAAVIVVLFRMKKRNLAIY